MGRVKGYHLSLADVLPLLLIKFVDKVRITAVEALANPAKNNKTLTHLKMSLKDECNPVL